MVFGAMGNSRWMDEKSLIVIVWRELMLNTVAWKIDTNKMEVQVQYN